MAPLFCIQLLTAQPHCEVDVRLLAGQHSDVGNVIVTNDADRLTVTYRLHPEAVDVGWRIYETQLAVAEKLAGIPQTRGNRWGTNPIPDRFPFAMDDPQGATEHTEHLSLADFGAKPGDTLYIAAHAKVSGQGAWGEGTRFNERGNWGMYFLYEVCEEARSEAMVLVEGGTLKTDNLLDGTEVDTFYIGRHEVTWDDWKAVREEAVARGYDIDNIGAGCGDDHPVHTVNWYHVVKWCNLKSEIEGLTPVYTISGATYKSGESIPSQDLTANGYRLPLDAEWEFAARGGNKTENYIYSGSDNIDDVAWYSENSVEAACPLWNDRGTWPVGEKASNELGLHDMSGNVYEWCWDASGSSFRVLRGGGWGSLAVSCRSASRHSSGPGGRSGGGGFRLARSSVP